MKLMIMTKGRVGKQTTLSWIPESWLSKCWLVTTTEECNSHANYFTTLDSTNRLKDFTNLLPVPPSVTNYSQKFQWIINERTIPGADSDKVVILDDDLVFSKKDENGSLKTIRDPDQLAPLFSQMEALLDEYPLVGVHPRQMGQNAKTPLVENGRIICIQGINRRLVGNVKVDQFPILADVVLNLTLLGRGQSNALITTFFQDHGPCQAPGGCSIYRTPAMQQEAVNYLANRFPGFVKAVVRKPKVAKWMGDERHEYTAQWKKLHAAGVAHVLDPGKVPHPDKEVDRGKTYITSME